MPINCAPWRAGDVRVWAKKTNKQSMSSKQKREIARVVLVLTLHLYPLQLCHSVSPGQQPGGGLSPPESAGGRWGQTHGAWRSDEKTHHSANLRKTSRSGPQGLRSESAPSPGETLPPFILQKVDERGRNVASNNLSWTGGHISTGPKASAQDHEEGYQADFTGWSWFKGKLNPVYIKVNLQVLMSHKC